MVKIGQSLVRVRQNLRREGTGQTFKVGQGLVRLRQDLRLELSYGVMAQFQERLKLMTGALSIGNDSVQFLGIFSQRLGDLLQVVG
ncbi:hypothetical protein FQZ97_956460 [compost metagenome]